MSNGKVIEKDIHLYVEQIGDNITELAATVAPAYYGLKGASSTMLKTGDMVVGPAAFAAAAAAALGALSGVGLRKRGKHTCS